MSNILDSYGRSIEVTQEGNEDVYREATSGITVRRPHGDPSDLALDTFNAMAPPAPDPTPVPIVYKIKPVTHSPLVSEKKTISSSEWIELANRTTRVRVFVEDPNAILFGGLSGFLEVTGGRIGLRVTETEVLSDLETGFTTFGEVRTLINSSFPPGLHALELQSESPRGTLCRYILEGSIIDPGAVGILNDATILLYQAVPQ